MTPLSDLKSLSNFNKIFAIIRGTSTFAEWELQYLFFCQMLSIYLISRFHCCLSFQSFDFSSGFLCVIWVSWLGALIYLLVLCSLMLHSNGNRWQIDRYKMFFVTLKCGALSDIISLGFPRSATNLFHANKNCWYHVLYEFKVYCFYSNAGEYAHQTFLFF